MQRISKKRSVKFRNCQFNSNKKKKIIFMTLSKYHMKIKRATYDILCLSNNVENKDAYLILG